MVVNGQVVVYTGRAIANVLTFYYDANPDQPKPVTDDDKIKALNEQVTKLNAELATSEASLKASQEKVTALRVRRVRLISSEIKDRGIIQNDLGTYRGIRGKQKKNNSRL